MKNAAIITASSGKSAEIKIIPGVFNCLLEHTITSTKAEFDYTGPKISRSEWAAMLRYFRWTYDEEKSEAQVRGYVHPEHGWKIWAYPQKGGTGMTTREENNADFAAQRAQIPDGYVQFMTVHHHCSMAAFQSGTDEADEKSVDGLHITVGLIDRPVHDIHCRIYIKGNRFEPNMSAFWDVGPELQPHIDFIKGLGFSEEKILDMEARRQMCQAAPADTEIPQQWKDNYLLDYNRNLRKARDGIQSEANHGIPKGTSWCQCCRSYVFHKAENCPKKAEGPGRGGSRNGPRTWSAEDVIDEMEQACYLAGIDEPRFGSLIYHVSAGEDAEFYQILVRTCADNFITVEKLGEAYAKMAESEGGIQKNDENRDEIEKAIKEMEEEAARMINDGGENHTSKK